jgi:hypothetical protein
LYSNVYQFNQDKIGEFFTSEGGIFCFHLGNIKYGIDDPVYMAELSHHFILFDNFMFNKWFSYRSPLANKETSSSGIDLTLTFQRSK